MMRERSPRHRTLFITPGHLGRIALAAGGLAADSAIGLAILRGASPWALLVHLPAALAWAEGISLLEGGSLRRALSARLAGRVEHRDVAPINGRTLVLALTGLLLFPGFGTLGCTVALLLSSLRVMAHRQRALPPTHIEAALPALPESARDPMDDLAVEPLVDILREPDNTLRQAAIRLLGRRCDRESVALLRGLLSDANPDIRSAASTTLFTFENQLNRTLAEALDRVRREPEDADAYADLAATYRRIVACDLLDAPSAHLYLTRASDALRKVTTLAPRQGAYWVALARVLSDLDETDAAAEVIQHALALAPDDHAARLLAMEIAFRAQRWADLSALSAAISPGAPDEPDVHALLDWWVGNAPALATVNERVA